MCYTIIVKRLRHLPQTGRPEPRIRQKQNLLQGE